MINNAKIVKTKLGEEHGCLIAEIVLRGDGWSCVFGGYSLDSWDREYCTNKDGYGAIIELMKTLEVNSWEEINGLYVRADCDGWGGKIKRIGNLLKDKWFSFEEYFTGVKEKEKK